MPTLHWVGKEAVLNHHEEVPFHLLQADAALSVGDPDSGNLLVEGDNLLALKALLPYYAGKVKCIYIDPPYNTGNESWVYNDNVNSPDMRDWLGKVVGKEVEDLSRHDKWLCMMYPRLVLLRQFLREDGSFWMSIDDNEVHHARMLLDDIFGANNSVSGVIWQKKVSPANDALWFSGDHEHILVYAKDKTIWRPYRLPKTDSQKKYYKNPDNDPRGSWNSTAYTCAKSADERPNLYYPITNPNTGQEIWPKRTRVWAFGQERHTENVENDLVYWGKDGKAKMPRFKKLLSTSRKVVPRSIWFYSEVGHTQEARMESLELFPKQPFPTPKPERLIERVLQCATVEDDIVLDSFLGSGTTAAVADKLNRRYIGIEMMSHSKTHVAPRLQKTVSENEKSEGGFRYCRLGETLFDAAGQIRASVTFAELARHVFFSETGSPLTTMPTTPLIGTFKETAIYLLYNGILHDTAPDGGNILTRALLATLPAHDGRKIIYANGCLIAPATLAAHNITFRQTPYEIKVQ